MEYGVKNLGFYSPKPWGPKTAVFMTTWVYKREYVGPLSKE